MTKNILAFFSYFCSDICEHRYLRTYAIRYCNKYCITKIAYLIYIGDSSNVSKEQDPMSFCSIGVTFVNSDICEHPQRFSSIVTSTVPIK